VLPPPRIPPPRNRIKKPYSSSCIAVKSMLSVILPMYKLSFWTLLCMIMCCNCLLFRSWRPKRLQLRSSLEDQASLSSFNQVPRSEVPSRFDYCKLFLSGVIGSDPKEIYLANGHYALNFGVSLSFLPFVLVFYYFYLICMDFKLSIRLCLF
jgi:hypothetical protein